MIGAEHDRSLNFILRSVAECIDHGEFSFAIRRLDRAVRTNSKHVAILVPILGRLQLWHGSDSALTLATLLRAERLQPSQDVSLDLVHCWLSLGRIDAARGRLASLLARYSATPESPIADAARALITRSPGEAGFVLLTPDLRLYAESLSDLSSCELRTGSGDLVARTEMVEAADGRAKACWLNISQVDQKQFLIATADGRSLLGGERILPVDFRVDGRSTAQGSQVEGWVRMDWNTATPIELEVCDEKGRCKRILAARPGPLSRWHYQFSIDETGLGNHLRIEVPLPDGTCFELSDSPLLLQPELDAQLKRISPSARRPGAARRISRKSQTPARPVTVIIPVYLGRDETLACIHSVCTTVSGVADVLVIDDASPDSELAADLDALADRGEIRLLRNPVNSGFAASVNRAMSAIGESDAALVNADAVVFGDWLERLRNAAYGADNIGSVTPFSTDDSVARCNDGRAAVDVVLAQTLDHFAASAYAEITTELPVGVGFCQYLRRDCWDDTGPFDAAAFSKGYGEESDWCMRARKRGWTHVLAANVLVHHSGGGSFGDRRQALQERAQRLMNLRHPGYDAYVQKFLKADPLQTLRRGFDVYRLCSQDRPIVLLLMLSLPGGVDRFVADRCRKLREQNKLPLLLRPLKIGPEGCVLWCTDPRTTQLRFKIPSELDTLRDLLAALPIESVELHHFLGLDGRLVQSVLDLGKPVDAYLHDYSWICPRVTLMDETDRYCGEPNVRVCERCIERNGSDLMETIRVADLRRRTRRWLQMARRVIAPTQDTAVRYGRYLPGVSIDVEPLEAAPAISRPRFPSHTGTLRVGLIGAIGKHKGYSVLLECARDAIARDLNLEFVVIGYTSKDASLLKTGRVFVTGPYSDDEVPMLLEREQPDLIWLPSVWPETWCYTLTHAVTSGLPVVAFDIGAVAERLREWGLGELLDLDLSPSEVNDQLLKIAGFDIAAGPMLFDHAT